MLNRIRIWIERNAIDISNALLVIALFYFLVLGVSARFYLEYTEFFDRYIDISLIKFIKLMQVGVWLIVISLFYNYLYELVMWSNRNK